MTIKTNAPQVAHALRSVADMMPRAAYAGLRAWAVQDVLPALKDEAPARRLRQAVAFRVYARRDLPFVRVFCHLPLGAWFEYGTGLYGPKVRRIVPRSAESYVGPDGAQRRRKMLRIPTKQGPIYRPWSRGMKPQPWFFRSVKEQLSKVRVRVLRAFFASVARARRRASAAGA